MGMTSACVSEHLPSKKQKSLITLLGKQRKEHHSGVEFNVKSTILALETNMPQTLKKTLRTFWILKRNSRATVELRQFLVASCPFRHYVSYEIAETT